MVLKYSVGLDVSLKKVDACISAIDSVQRVKVMSTCSVPNSKTGFAKLVGWIEKRAGKEGVPLAVCMEATGVYHENLAHYLHGAGLGVSIVLPNKAKRYLQSIGLKSKNDKIDAKGLAQMGAEQNLTPWVRPSDVFVELRTLTRQRQSIQELITAEKNRLHAEEHSAQPIAAVTKQIKSHIRFLEKQKADVEAAIKKTVESDAGIAERLRNACTVKGLGLLSVATVAAETNGFQLFENYKQLVSYAGYDVVENQSGAHRGKTRISKKGNSRIRRILHMCALTAIGSEQPVFRSLYERVYERTGIKMKAVVAVQKKLLLTIYYLWKNNQPFDPDYQENKKAHLHGEKRELASGHSSARADKKSSQCKSLATQGKHPASDHTLFPLGKSKIKKTAVKKEKNVCI